MSSIAEHVRRELWDYGGRGKFQWLYVRMTFLHSSWKNRKRLVVSTIIDLTSTAVRCTPMRLLWARYLSKNENIFPALKPNSILLLLLLARLIWGLLNSFGILILPLPNQYRLGDWPWISFGSPPATFYFHQCHSIKRMSWMSKWVLRTSGWC